MEPNNTNPNQNPAGGGASASPVAYCRACGRPLAAGEQIVAFGTVYCAAHVPAGPDPASAQANPFQMPPPMQGGPMPGGAMPGGPMPGGGMPGGPMPGGPIPSGPFGADTNVSPGLAFVLGLLPGVGAIYNGQFAKGVVHVLIFSALVALSNSENVGNADDFFGALGAFWIFYMAFEAYHTARKRLFGQPTDEFSGLFAARGNRMISTAAPLALIALGIIFLLNNLGLMPIQFLARFWPIALILAGGYMLFNRLRPGSPASPDADSNNFPGANN